MSSYTLSATVAMSYDQGFGVLTELDVDPSVATMLPCAVVVRSPDDDTCLVEAFDPLTMTQFVPGLEQVAAEAGLRLTVALAALTEEH
jgi:Domain of unknown function DUF302